MSIYCCRIDFVFVIIQIDKGHYCLVEKQYNVVPNTYLLMPGFEGTMPSLCCFG